jgi:hypothetical protein
MQVSDQMPEEEAGCGRKLSWEVSSAGERLLYTQQVIGSIPIPPTNRIRGSVSFGPGAVNLSAHRRPTGVTA